MIGSMETSTFILLLFIPLFLFFLAFVLRRYGVQNWIIRKYIHTVGLIVAGLYGALIVNLTDILIVVLVLVAIVLVISLPPIRFLHEITEMSNREGESQKLLIVNGFSTVGGVVFLVIIFFDVKWIFLASIYCVAIGDGLGEFIGKPFGKHKYKILGQKSVEGSLAVLGGSILGGIISLVFFELYTFDLLLIVILASLVVTVIEGVSVLFIDNLVMPMAYALVLWSFTN